jgi:signal transduction histidine kinase/CheY-like chemotaxis protein
MRFEGPAGGGQTGDPSLILLSSMHQADESSPRSGQQLLPVGGGEMGSLIRSFDWSATPIGPVEKWSPTLRTMVSFLLANRFPLLLWWGSRYISIYNDAYRPILGTKHPWALGRPVSEVWSEIWSVLKPLIDTPFEGGPATWMEDIELYINRHGFLEESHFTVAYSPVPDETAARGIGGVLATVHEITEKVISERRVVILSDLSRASQAKNADEACTVAAAVLSNHSKDVPFALLYLIDAKRHEVRLAGAAGVEPGETVSPLQISMGASTSTWPVADVLQRQEIVFLDNLADRFGGLPPGPWADPPQSAVLVPLHSNKLGELVGFAIAGVSSRLRLDHSYRRFFELMAAQIATSIAHATVYEEERKRAEALAEIDRAKTKFFSNVSHEFRTPLTLMLGPLEDALRNSHDLGPKRREEITVAHRNALRLLRLVNTLLDFSRVEAGRAQALFQKTDLPEQTRDLASNFDSVCERAGLSLTIACEPLPRPVYVDRGMWEKIVLNLISNAFKFTLSGGIEIRLRGVGDHVELSVRDTGGGIPANELPHIFERFHRVEGQRGRTHEGSGIGLALVRELVHLHGGEVRVESAVGRGTTFTVALPYGEAHRGEKADPGARDVSATTNAVAFVEEALRWLPQSAESSADAPEVLHDSMIDVASTHTPAGSRARVLIADDNGDMRDYLRRLLTSRHDVETVGNGSEALQALRRQRPDLLLSDVMMPARDGFELLREIRADPQLSDLPVILLSARAGDEAKVEGLNAGADDYLVKPFSSQELLARINTNIAMARLRRDITAELEAQKTRLQAVLDTVPVAVWFTFDSEGQHVVGNRSASQMLHIPEASNVSLSRSPEQIPQHFRLFRNGKPLSPDQLPLRRAVRGETVIGEELELHFTDGTVTTGVVHAAPMRDRSGKIVGAVSAGLDITERKRTEEHRLLLLNELNHRVKNTLATVQSIAAYSFRGAAGDAGGREVFEARLMALSRAHDVLTNENWEGADLHDIIDQAISPYRGARPVRFAVTGPHVRLSAKMTLSMGMALHELATNAAKYGALSSDSGRVGISWQMSGDGRELRLEWLEKDGPPVASPSRRGFGTRLIERGLAQELDGETKIEYRPTGVWCEIKARLRS